MIKNRIVIIEDDAEAALWTREFLEESDFEVTLFATVTDAVSHIQFNRYDLILLDLNLPDYDGFELLKFINKHQITIPTIVLSAYSDTQTKLQAFKYGASDYICKPIDLEELEARMWVHLNKNSHFSLDTKREIFKEQGSVLTFKEIPLKLTKIEFDILSILLNNKNILISREALSKQLSSKANERSLDYHIRNIRKKIGDNGSNPQYLVTEYGMGYKLIV